MCIPEHYYVDCIRPTAPEFMRKPDEVRQSNVARFANWVADRVHRPIAAALEVRRVSPKPKVLPLH